MARRKKRRSKKRKSKGHVPLSILKARYKKLGAIIKRRS